MRGNDVDVGSADDGGVVGIGEEGVLDDDPSEATGLLTDDFLHIARRPEYSLFEPAEMVLKGKKGKLPDGRAFADQGWA